MKYDDGVKMNEDSRITECPTCRNEEFSDRAEYCRICGFLLYNRCEGYHEGGYHDEVITHNCPGNARYCETCGRPTEFLTKGILLPWENVGKKVSPPPTPPQTLPTLDDDEGDLPF